MTATSSQTSVLMGLSNDLAGAVERAGASVVAVNARQRVPSSGIHWRAGIVVTADHTVERDEDITVTLPDGQTVAATLAGRDPNTDIAVLRVSESAVPAAAIADASALKVGHMALAIGRMGDQGLNASLGVISAVGGPWRTGRGGRGGQIDQFIRADVTFYPGFSGGPLVDAAGQIVGVNTSGVSRSMGLTIPAETVNRVVDAVLSGKRTGRGYLGVSLQPVRLPDALKTALGVTDETGLIVVSTEDNGPAAHAGMMIGDVLVSLDGKPVAETETVQSLLAPEKVGQTIVARVTRGGQPVNVQITVGERPQREG